ncbi:MAG: hypothetical protein OEM97_04730 [Acidimicrobiia bacterium]|nr:hypothetical protein [Acidimicrobiia bacterium]
MGDGIERSIDRIIAPPTGGRFSHDDLQWVLERASMITAEASDRSFSETDAFALGRELGIEEASVRRAIRELRSRPPESSTAAGEVVLATPTGLPARVLSERIEAALRRRLMDRCSLHGAGCWTQYRDWWPDLQRIGSELHLFVELDPVSASSTHVRMRVDLRYKALGYGAWAGGGSAAVWLVLGPGALIPAFVSWAAISAAAVSAYRRRAGAIRARLEELLVEVG